MPPANKCANGKWKWGETGTCKYDSKKQAEDDNSSYRKKLGTIIVDGIEVPFYDTIEEAENEAKRLGGSGYHEHTLDGEVVYMPFDSHEELLKVMNSRSIKKYNNMEKRIYNIETRIDSTDDGKEMVVGHASMYNTRSEYMGFYETIEEGAFTDELINSSDVRALINHDQNLILARNTSGTLKLEADAQGLRYEFEMPETSYGKDLAVSMKRGDITQSSFAFTVEEDDWSTDDNGNDLRTIKKIKRLYDVSPVTYPAYQDANDLTIAQRGLAEYKETLKKVDVIEEVKEEKDLVSRSLAKLKIELKKRK